MKRHQLAPAISWDSSTVPRAVCNLPREYTASRFDCHVPERPLLLEEGSAGVFGMEPQLPGLGRVQESVQGPVLQGLGKCAEFGYWAPVCAWP